RPVLALADRLEVFDLDAATHVIEDLIFFALPIRRDDAADRLADHFLRRVAEHLLGGPVPGHHDAVQVLADDRIVARLDDRGEPVRGAVGTLAPAEIAHDPYRPAHAIVGAH